MSKAGRPLLGLSLVLTLTALILFVMGRTLWCRGGSPVPWSWDIWSMHNSQHLLDPYTFSHLQHGLVFYGLFFLLLRRRRRSRRFMMAMVLEASWEILENSQIGRASCRERV